MARYNLKSNKKVKCDGRTDRPTDQRTDGPTKQDVESGSTQLITVWDTELEWVQIERYFKNL